MKLFLAFLVLIFFFSMFPVKFPVPQLLIVSIVQIIEPAAGAPLKVSVKTVLMEPIQLVQVVDSLLIFLIQFLVNVQQTVFQLIVEA